MVDLTFTDPVYLWLLLSIPLLILTHFLIYKKVKMKAMIFANFEALKRARGKRILQTNNEVLFLRILSFLLIIMAASGATIWYETDVVENTYILAIDVSGSMLANDFTPSRMDAAKTAAFSFVDSIGGQARVGLISFAGISYIEQPITRDLDLVKLRINSLGTKDTHGTAIGDTILSAINLVQSEPEGSILILITDGQETVAPEELEKVVDYAEQMHLKIYTIGIGTKEGGYVDYLPKEVGVIFTINDDNLEYISSSTGGKSYLVTDEAGIKAAYKSIILEKQQEVSLDITFWLILGALGTLFFEWVIINTRKRAIP